MLREAPTRLGLAFLRSCRAPASASGGAVQSPQSPQSPRKQDREHCKHVDTRTRMCGHTNMYIYAHTRWMLWYCTVLLMSCFLDFGRLLRLPCCSRLHQTLCCSASHVCFSLSCSAPHGMLLLKLRSLPRELHFLQCLHRCSTRCISRSPALSHSISGGHRAALLDLSLIGLGL